MTIFNTRTIILISIIFITGVFWVNFVSAQCETSGWAYSDTVSWISFDCESCPPGNPTGCGEDVNICKEEEWKDYGVKIDSTGLFSGYAWNGYVGWISFADFDGDGDVDDNDRNISSYCAPNCQAQINYETNQITGWGRILSLVNAPGGGWISLNCLTDPSPEVNHCLGINYGVYFDQCEFRGWAWSDDIGWVCFNCKDDEEKTGSSACTNYPDYKVKCGAAAPPFNLLSVQRDGDFPCSAVRLKWEKNEETAGEINSYKIYRNDVLIKTLRVGTLDNPCAVGEDCIACAANECDYADVGLNPESSYSYRIEACTACGCRSQSNSLPPATTTICSSALTFCPPNNPDFCYSDCSSFQECKDQICSQGEMKLQWTQARGKGETDGADGGYILYRALGGGWYQKLKEIVQFGNEGGENPKCSYSLGIYSCEEDIEIGKHYYFFVRAVDGPDNGIDQDVDSNRVEICCLSQ